MVDLLIWCVTYAWHLDLVSLHQVLGEDLNELLGGHVPHSVSVGVDQSKMLL